MEKEEKKEEEKKENQTKQIKIPHKNPEGNLFSEIVITFFAVFIPTVIFAPLWLLPHYHANDKKFMILRPRLKNISDWWKFSPRIIRRPFIREVIMYLINEKIKQFLLPTSIYTFPELFGKSFISGGIAGTFLIISSTFIKRVLHLFPVTQPKTQNTFMSKFMINFFYRGLFFGGYSSIKTTLAHIQGKEYEQIGFWPSCTVALANTLTAVWLLSPADNIQQYQVVKKMGFWDSARSMWRHNRKKLLSPSLRIYTVVPSVFALSLLDWLKN